MVESRWLGIRVSLCTFKVYCISGVFHNKSGGGGGSNSQCGAQGKRWQLRVMGGEPRGEGLIQPTQRPLKGRTAKGSAGLGTGNLSQDGTHVSLVFRPLLS